MDEATGKLIGHLSDIGTGGFKVDSNQLLPLNVDFRLRIDQIGEISNKMCLIFKARAMWCRHDLFDPNMYNVGFKIVDMTPGDHDIFMKMFNKYGVKDPSQNDNSDYAWK
jgi:hypothetical protein